MLFTAVEAALRKDQVVVTDARNEDVARLTLGQAEATHLRDQLLAAYPLTPPEPPPAAPPPAPEPPDPAATDSFRGLADGLPPRYRPFAADSPWNRGPRNPTWQPDSAAMIANLPWTGVPAPMTALPVDGKDYGHPIFFARESDPLYKIVCSGSSNGQQMRIPEDFRWASGTDGHGQVVQPDGRAYGCWQITSVDKVKREIRCTYCYWQNYAGLGCVPHGTGTGPGNGGTTASYFDQDAGIVRARHLLDRRIEHALFVVVKYLSSSPQYTWPAAKGDQYGPSGVLLPTMGDRLILDVTEAEIRAQGGVAEWEQTIQIAAAEFGMLCGDTGGPGVGLHAESKLSPGAGATWSEVIARYKIPFVSGYGYSFVFRSPLWKRLKVAARENA